MLPRFATLLAFATVFTMMTSPAAAHPDKFRVYIGTYTGKNSKGIYRCELDVATGKLSQPELAAETANPTFLALHPTSKFLYAINEIGNFQGQKAGGVSAFAIDPATGELKLLNQQSSKGTGPCHIIVDKVGKNVLVANYGGGSATVLPIQADGQLGEATGFQQHKGQSIVKGRQEGPHAHSVNLDAANRFAFVADLGLDKVLVYQFDGVKGTITPHEPPALELAPGAGPRHFAFHPSGQHAFVINELDSTLTALAYDADKGTFTKRETVSTLPDAKPVQGNSTAEVVVHPSGKFVYGSNRGHNSIAVFAFDAKNGLTPTSHQGADIKTPRNFNVDPTGRWMLVGNQAGNSVIVFEIDQQTGALKPTGNKIELGAPVCIKFVALGK